MSQKGMTLIELVVVITIIGILSAITTLNFVSWKSKSRVESEAKEIYADLMTVRSEALFRKKPRTIVMTSTSFSVYSSDQVVGTPVLQKSPLKETLTYNASTITFDDNGVATPAVAVCVGSSGNAAGADSIVVNTTSVQLGKLSSGGGCSSANITPK